MRFVLIPAGKFVMGTPVEASLRGSDETPHEVTISRPFYLQSTEVAWRDVRRWDPSAEGYTVDGQANGADDQAFAGASPGSRVEGFIAWLNARDPGRAYRLPSEAEWEYACRAGTDSTWFWGDDPRRAVDHAAVGDRADLVAHPDWSVFPVEDDGFRGIAPVGSFRPNAWGLHDMIGNVAEWVADGYGPLGPEPVVDPVARADTPERVARGGAYYTSPLNSRSAVRHRFPWRERAITDVGFRIAADVPTPK
jgi:formylglycine-generating enzyme required for sulfatase activity